MWLGDLLISSQFSTGDRELDDDDETLTAYHEAGHAVVGYALGARIERVQLGGEADDELPERFGDCLVNWGRVSPECSWQRQCELMTILAGPVAEMIYRGEPLHPAHYGPWQGDWQQAWMHCPVPRSSVPRSPVPKSSGPRTSGPKNANPSAVSSDSAADRIARDRSKTRILEQMIRELHDRMSDDQCWAAIAAVADELLAHEYLDEEQLSGTLEFWIG